MREPLRLLWLQFDELTPEEEDLYFELWCNYCGKLLQDNEYDNHLCAAKQQLRSYYKGQDFN